MWLWWEHWCWCWVPWALPWGPLTKVPISSGVLSASAFFGKGIASGCSWQSQIQLGLGTTSQTARVKLSLALAKAIFAIQSVDPRFTLLVLLSACLDAKGWKYRFAFCSGPWAVILYCVFIHGQQWCCYWWCGINQEWLQSFRGKSEGPG